ncbi:ArsR/SmtB family transcription factor [Roseateles sp.]|uniref:ArsR/SmtB family transcription factor n=1 Tax=Roseateles sp. TaxID=1971397 RepID=UPI0039E76D76
MVKSYTHSLDYTFFALADPTRRAILARLSQGEATASELAKPFDMSLVAVGKHLRLLETAGLVRRDRNGRTVTCHLEATPLAQADAWLAGYRAFWDGNIASLSRFLATWGPERSE